MLKMRFDIMEFVLKSRNILYVFFGLSVCFFGIDKYFLENILI